MTCSVIIPALNEEASIGNVIRTLPATELEQIIVVDNASTDATASIALRSGATVVREPRRGYGQACLAGIAALNPVDIVIFMDADGSDDPDDLDKLLDPIRSGEAEFVIGSRKLGTIEPGSMTIPQRFGNELATFLIRLFWGVRYTDLGPFRVIRRESLEKLGMQDTNYGWTVEMQIKAIAHRLAVVEVPVSYRRRVGKSKISGTVRGVLGAGYKIIYTIFKYRFLSLAWRVR